MVGVPVQAVMGHRAVPGHGVSRNRPVSRSSYNFKQLLQTHFSLDIALNSRFSREGCHKRGAFRHDAPFKDQMRRVNRLLQPLNASHRANSPQVVKLEIGHGFTLRTMDVRLGAPPHLGRQQSRGPSAGVGRGVGTGLAVIRSTPMTAPTTTD